ncbi:MAG TPA: HAMP domain-containing sensor histidine kinase [Hyphomicrobiales bacterium]|jgi:signal transduction histidine kinase
MSRLYLRIYLAVLGSLLVFALLAALSAVLLRVFEDDDRREWPEIGSEIVEQLPAGQGAAELRAELDVWHERTGLALALVAADGTIIAEAGDFPRWFHDSIARHPFDRPSWWARRGAFGMTLDDGRRLVAIRAGPHRDWTRHFRWLAALLGIGIAVGVSAYPVVRHLTRRLERLQQGVAAFGGGDLSTRVEVSGNDEIAKLGEIFNASAERIENLLNAHKFLLANASHELRSPLSRLKMAVEGLSGKGLSGNAREEIGRNIGELDDLVEEILLASRLQANAAREVPSEPVDLVGLLAEECAAFDAELSVPGGATVTVAADPRLLRRLFRNLLENAGRYGGSGPAIVTMRAGSSEAEISVCDSGPGVPEAEREKIFEPFYRLKSASESGGGAGLGLSLVRQIAERHGGRVRCVAGPGGGACFEVSLPLAKPAK